MDWRRLSHFRVAIEIPLPFMANVAYGLHLENVCETLRQFDSLGK